MDFLFLAPGSDLVFQQLGVLAVAIGFLLELGIAVAELGGDVEDLVIGPTVAVLQDIHVLNVVELAGGPQVIEKGLAPVGVVFVAAP